VFRWGSYNLVRIFKVKGLIIVHMGMMDDFPTISFRRNACHGMLCIHLISHRPLLDETHLHQPHWPTSTEYSLLSSAAHHEFLTAQFLCSSLLSRSHDSHIYTFKHLGAGFLVRVSTKQSCENATSSFFLAYATAQTFQLC